MMTVVAQVWVIRNADFTVDPLAVSGTRRAALVNWLVLRGVPILPVMDDMQVERLWEENRGSAQIHTVRIS